MFVKTKRMRGRKAVAQRHRRLIAEPLCRDCLAMGRVTEAIVPDHIIPLAHGGSDRDSNIRCLCAPCHAIRTREQFAPGTPNNPVKMKVDTDGWPVIDPPKKSAEIRQKFLR